MLSKKTIFFDYRISLHRYHYRHS